MGFDVCRRRGFLPVVSPCGLLAILASSGPMMISAGRFPRSRRMVFFIYPLAEKQQRQQQ
jgi:hypothetical protein